jgi:ribosomal protein L18E
MAFSVGTLAAYTKENEALLVASSVLGSKTASLIKDKGNVMVGVKSAETINIMDTDAIFQDGSSCGFNASGTTSFTQRTVTVGKIKVNEALCLKDLEAKYLQKALPAGSSYDSMVYSEEYSKRKSEKIAEQLEKTLWQGSTASVDVNLNKFQGITTLITAAGASVVNANSVALHGVVETSITDTNVISIFDDIYKAIPAQVVDKDDIAIFCGMDVFRTYTVKLKTSNLYHYQYDGKANGEFYLPGTNVKVIAVQGLNGSGKIVAARISNFFIGTDLLNEEERFEIFYAKEADQVRFVSEFKMGVNFAFPDEIVKFFV